MQENNKPELSPWLILTYVTVPLASSIWSTYHVLDLFKLGNDAGIALGIALTFELALLASLAGIMKIHIVGKNSLWFMLILLLSYQLLGNVYAAYNYLGIHMQTVPTWLNNFSEMLGMTDFELITIKRVTATVLGLLFPVISLIFLHFLMKYITHIREMQGLIVPERVQQPEAKQLPEKEPSEEQSHEEVAQTEEKPIEDIEHEESAPEAHEDFSKFIQEKKKKFAGMKDIHLELLNIFYEDGKTQSGGELMKYSDFIKKIDLTRIPQKEINLFLMLCNYLEIFQVSGSNKIALKSYEDAKQVLENYLTI